MKHARFALPLMMLAACSSCAGSLAEVSGAGLSAATQTSASVEIWRLCVGPDGEPRMGLGSGLLLEGDRVLTAGHVTKCAIRDSEEVEIASYPPVGMLVSATGALDSPPDGAILATTLIVVPNLDIAILQLAHPLPGATPAHVRVGPRPVVGERICDATNYPKHSYRCGTVQDSGSEGRIITDIYAEHGNSGSGVFVNGALVGVLTGVWTCSDGHYCQSSVAPLQDYAYLVNP